MNFKYLLSYLINKNIYNLFLFTTSLQHILSTNQNMSRIKNSIKYLYLI